MKHKSVLSYDSDEMVMQLSRFVLSDVPCSRMIFSALRRSESLYMCSVMFDESNFT